MVLALLAYFYFYYQRVLNHNPSPIKGGAKDKSG
jgi:hypothetical protein